MKSPWRTRWLLSAFVAAVAVASVIVALSHSTPRGPWTWNATGVLSTDSKCSTLGRSRVPSTCQFQVANPPRTTGEVKLDVRVRNTASTKVCYALSITTSYLAGLQEFCAQPKAYGSYVRTSRAKYFVDFSLDLFVTNDSTTQPLAPTPCRTPSPFRVIFSEARA